MSRRRYGTRHKPVAQGLRQTPGEWSKVCTYAARYTARNAAHRIRQGVLPDYLPAGSFEADVRWDEDGEPTVFARFVGQEVAA